MKNRYKINSILCVLILLVTAICTGCGEGITDTTEAPAPALKADQVYIYYVDDNCDKLIPVVMDLDSPGRLGSNVEQIMNKVITSDNTNGYKTAITSNLLYKGTDIVKEDKEVTVYFDMVDETWTPDLAVLAKSAVVKSLIQLDDIEQVNISIYNLLSTEENPITLESFDEDSLVYSDAANNGYTQGGNITIYFADENGENLKEYHKRVNITNNVSLEQIVMDSLIEGPLQDGYNPTIPDGVEVLKVSVKDGVCYLDLNDAFNGSVDNIRSDLTVYSVVNSLVELPTINKVQFFINGEKQDVYRETMDFGVMFERNNAMIESTATTESELDENGNPVTTEATTVEAKESSEGIIGKDESIVN